MSLGVVILNWNAERDTDRCLGSIAAWPVRPGGTEVAIWVVDNNSTDGGGERLAESHRQACVIRSDTNLGFAGGNNRGIEAALAEGCDPILLLNNDAMLEAADLELMLETLASEESIGIVGPTLWHGERLLSAGGRDIARFGATHLRPARLPQQAFDVDYVSGTAALLSRRLIEQVGTLDEDYFFSGEMADLAKRARGAGFRCVTDPRARAQHAVERSSDLRERLHAYYVIRNRFLYFRKHYPRRTAALTALWIARGTKTIAGSLLTGRAARARASYLGLIDGLRGRFGGSNDRVLAAHD